MRVLELTNIDAYFCTAQDDQILIDLNSLDNTTINSTGEYFDMDRIIFLFNDTVEYFSTVSQSSVAV